MTDFSIVYKLHFVLVQVIFFALISLASLNLLNSKRVISDIIDLQLDQIKDTIDIGREPYIVTKLAKTSNDLEPSTTLVIGEDAKQEMGYVATYISAEFCKAIIS